ncbi:hypothetical protein FSP39_009943 [Pinctada imbricata]|uniref:Integrase p58-like C-terminal domain-containing protein n=1 Tax=Pinctada imbricata TaxID=66713 RepID=A0AA88YTB8_PINIB|nr:hypothetical protein FSP39_009943 [Pinctada imbricata]
MAYRASVQESTKCSPNLLMFGREICFPLDISIGYPPCDPEPVCSVFYVEWLRQAMRNSFDFAYENLKAAACRQKKLYDRGIRPRTFEVGQWMWRWYPPSANRKHDKGWVGPYLITRKLGIVNYQIQKDPNAPLVNVHVDHLKPFEGVVPQSNWIDVASPGIGSEDESSVDDDGSNLPGVENIEGQIPPLSTSPPTSPVEVRTRTSRLVKPKDVYSP